MAAVFELVLAILSTESSYAREIERPATQVPDTIQFWLAPSVQWRIRTYAIDHDIHTHTLGPRADGSSFTTEEAIAHTKKHYSDIISSIVVLTLRDPNDKEEVRRVLAGHKLTGTLETGKSGVAFYNPDSGEYRSKSRPK
jgi:hypothetical protein